MKFYDCSTAPSPRRVRFFVAEKGVKLDTVQVDLAHGENLGEDFSSKNPDCTVPVLELDDGTCISEVLAICEYLEAQFPDKPLLGSDAREKALVTMWVCKTEQQGLSAVAELFRNRAKGFRGRAVTGPHGFEQIPELAERGLRRVELFLDRLERQLDGRQYLVDDYFSFADISAFVAVEFAGWSKIAIGDHRPNLAKWYSGIAEKPASRA